MIADVPVDPDDDEARQWLEEELGAGGTDVDAPAEPPQWWLDFLEWLRRLLNGGGPSSGAGIDTGQTVGVVVAVVLVVALLVVAFAIFGLPRLRSRSRVTGDLFGELDDRTSTQLRSAAQRAADAGDFTSAVVEVFRSLARDLAERGIVATFPGTTAHDFARRATRVFPDATERLADAATVFDGVRYLGATGTEEQWRRMAALDVELRQARPPRSLRAADALDAELAAEIEGGSAR
jgi:hypothetical protein